MKTIKFVLFAFSFVALVSCCGKKKQSTTVKTDGSAEVSNSAGEESVVMKLYGQYKAGEIEKCSWNGKMVYKCAVNAYDAGNEIYDMEGEKIGSCYYNSGKVDAVCRELTECKAIWRNSNNIWGKPAANEIGVEPED